MSVDVCGVAWHDVIFLGHAVGVLLQVPVSKLNCAFNVALPSLLNRLPEKVKSAPSLGLELSPGDTFV